MPIYYWYRSTSKVKPTRNTIFEFIKYHSTCFGRSFRPSSGVQDCTYSISYMSYRFVDCLLAATSSISCTLTSSQRTCVTCTWCCMYSLELLMMNGKTETWRVIFNKLYLVGFTIEKYHDERSRERQNRSTSLLRQYLSNFLIFRCINLIYIIL